MKLPKSCAIDYNSLNISQNNLDVMDVIRYSFQRGL